MCVNVGAFLRPERELVFERNNYIGGNLPGDFVIKLGVEIVLPRGGHMTAMLALSWIRLQIAARMRSHTADITGHGRD